MRPTRKSKEAALLMIQDEFGPKTRRQRKASDASREPKKVSSSGTANSSHPKQEAKGSKTGDTKARGKGKDVSEQKHNGKSKAAVASHGDDEAKIRASSSKFLQESLAAGAEQIRNASKERTSRIPKTKLAGLAREIEQALFEAQGSTTGNEYRAEVRSKGLTIRKDNPEVAFQLLNDVLKAHTFAKMTAQELRTSKMMEADRTIQQRNMESVCIASPDEIDYGAAPLAGSSEGVEVIRDAASRRRLRGNGSRRKDDSNGEALDVEEELKVSTQPSVTDEFKGIEFERGDAV